MSLGPQQAPQALQNLRLVVYEKYSPHAPFTSMRVYRQNPLAHEAKRSGPAGGVGSCRQEAHKR